MVADQISARFPRVWRLLEARQWLLFHLASGSAENTIAAYGSDLELYLNLCEAARVAPIDANVDSLIELGLHYLKFNAHGGTTAKSTVARRLSTLRQWYMYLRERGCRSGGNPFLLSAMKRGRKRAAPWIPTDMEWTRIVQTVRRYSLRNRLMFSIAYELALRRNELCSLRILDFDHANRCATIRADTSKSIETRVLQFSSQTARLLVEYERTISPASVSSQLFLSESNRNAGSAVTANSWNKVVARIRDDVGLKRLHPHTLRHLSLTDLARAGWQLHELRTFAGHRSSATTMLYIHLSGRDLAASFQRATLHAPRLSPLLELTQ